MKTCPRCGAAAFDDADVCYGCLYRFMPQEVEDARKQNDQDPSMQDGIPNELGSNRHEQSSGQNALAQEALAPLKARSCESPLPASFGQEPPEFSIHLIPRHDPWGGWKWDCSVEIAEKVRHEVVGRHALQVH